VPVFVEAFDGDLPGHRQRAAAALAVVSWQVGGAPVFVELFAVVFAAVLAGLLAEVFRFVMIDFFLGSLEEDSAG